MQKFECKVCGAELYWDSTANALKCKYCDAEFQPSDFEDKTLEEDAVNQNSELDAQYTNAGADIGEDMVVYACSECGAEVVASKTTMATVCAYCGRAINITNKSAGDFRPEKVIPFAVEHDKAVEIFKKYAKSSPLVPKTFYEQHTVEKIQGLYVPFWLHSLRSKSSAVVRGDHTTSRKSGYDKIDTIKVYEVDMDADGVFKNIPADASKKLDNKLMDALEPFSYSKIKAFNPAYMAGYFAEQPDEKADETFERAENRAKEAMNQQMISKAGSYSNKHIVSGHHDIGDKHSEYAMLPVWLLNVDYNGQKYLYAINGETGKACGELPMSKGKLALYGAIAFLVGNFGNVIFTLVSAML